MMAPHTDLVTSVIDTYALDVTEGRIPAGKYHRLACERHNRDRDREGSPSFPYYLDVAAAERFFRFAERLKHYKGQWAGQFIRLEPYQKFRLGSIIGWRHVETGLRRFRTAYNELPRKNGKSLEAAIVALYITFFDGEPGAEGYCAATKRAQALIVFRDAKKLVQSSGLRTRIRVQVANMHREETASKLEPLSADYGSMDGLNPSLIINDEFHAQKDRGLIDVLETATGSRLQPLNFQITTAGDDPVSPCGDQHAYACKILDRVLDDEAFFAFIAHADIGDDWLSEDTWRKASPNYGVSVIPADIRALALKAAHMPPAAAAFQQKRLNWWVNALTPWLSMEGWRKGQSEPEAWGPDDLRGAACYVGVDLASKLDLCSLVFTFPPTAERPTWRLLVHAWTPEATAVERGRRDRAPYPTWIEQGHIHGSPGERIDHVVIRNIIREHRGHFDIRGIAFDPWHASDVIDALVREDGFAPEQVIEVPQTFAGMSRASLEFEADVAAGLIDAASNPLMGWAVSNAVVQRDHNDNVTPSKKRSRGRIDPVVAAILGRRLAEADRAPLMAEDPDLVVA